ncbi:AraC-like DNA-binding protein [Catalinimonas alkaloidigena]|uniref:helix-turn-helix domain-containing protein n=1 Tax=Catalinimonas alkaloidigena TaxID=1075417 RepID=UPI0024059ACF|nr:helix-turn-helix domain-containing protein [Catalinimonas alkaloidigena]MDF9800236.1 AraC-like DNA-binding protein [Catalinimonas alkaloidigena]
MNPSSPSLDHWTIIFLFAAAHGLFLSWVIYFHKKGRQSANRLLAAIMLLFAISLVYYVAYWTQYINLIHRAFGIVLLFPMLIGPLFLGYFHRLNGRKFERKDWLHYLPFTLVLIWYAPIYFNADTSVLNQAVTDILYSRQTMFFRVILLNAHVLAYCIYLFIYLSKQQQVRLSGDKFTDRRIGWMRKSAFCYLGFTLSFLSYYLLVYTIDFSIVYDYAISASMTIFIYMVGYMGYRQPEVITGYAEEAAQKYVKSGLSTEEAEVYTEQLLQYMKLERPYLSPELKLGDLAGKLEVSRHHLSQIINGQLGLTFSDFVNRYRVEEAQRILADADYRELKILAVAFEAGFNTKASFYNAFRKMTGTSPKRYRKQQLKLQRQLN